MHISAIRLTLLLSTGALVAACGADTAPSGEATDRNTGNASSTITPIPEDAPPIALASCNADVIYSDMPSDLASDKLTRYTELTIDGQTVMRFAIGPSVTDAQVERAVRLARFYLQDVPGSAHGADKSAVRNALAENKATMVMPDGAHEEGASDGLPQGQELYAAEIAPEGSSWYINNDFDHRDAALEEIFHQVHDVGIGTSETRALPEYQKDILARAESTQGTIWGINSADWLKELGAEGSLAQEYIAAVIDSWYGQWGPWSGNQGMWDTYVAKTRADVESKDPEGATLLRAFLPDVLDYEAYLDPTFQGTFSMAFDESQPYTHKSQYLRGARLNGTNAANLQGNDLDNTLRGNSSDNTLDGGAGTDTAIYCKKQAEYTISTEGDVTTVTGPDGTDTLTGVEKIAFADTVVDL